MYLCAYCFFLIRIFKYIYFILYINPLTESSPGFLSNVLSTSSRLL